MPLQIAIAICHNLHDTAERAKFNDEQILWAIATVLEKEDTRTISKQAYVNALRFVFEKLINYVKENENGDYQTC